MNKKIMPVMVSFFTHGWIQQCVRCWQKWFPELKILIIDNNPLSKEQMEKWDWSFMNSKWKLYFKYCLAERDWLLKQKNTIVLSAQRRTNKQLTHGRCLDQASIWCEENGYEIMVCVEPDTYFDSICWFYELIEPIVANDMWITARRLKNNLSHQIEACPLAVKVKKVNYSFDHINVNNQYYDCANYLFKRHKDLKKAEFVNIKRNIFTHYFNGTYHKFISNKKNCSYVTFL